MSWTMEIVSSANFRMVNDGPSMDTSSEKMMLIREPSSRAPSMMGLLSDTGRPMRSDMALR